MAELFPAESVPVEVVEEPAVDIRKTSLTPKLGQSWFRSRFDSVQWAYLGSNELSGPDTTYTRDVRAMLEARFGAPTKTLADYSAFEEISEFIQFEYWFVLNDTIPFVVMDVNGPFERGVVVATDQAYRDALPDLKQQVLDPAVSAGERAPYVDYYFLREQRSWYLTGFDGDRFFLERIQRPNLRLGRPLPRTAVER